MTHEEWLKHKLENDPVFANEYENLTPRLDVPRTRSSNDVCITAAEALYGFMAWLTTRSETVTLGSSHECSGVAELLDQFIKENNLGTTRPYYPSLINFPKDKPVLAKEVVWTGAIRGSSLLYHPDEGKSMYFLKSITRYTRDRQHNVGHVYLNEVLDALGYDHVSYGGIMGWVRESKFEILVDSEKEVITTIKLVPPDNVHDYLLKREKSSI